MFLAYSKKNTVQFTVFDLFGAGLENAFSTTINSKNVKHNCRIIVLKTNTDYKQNEVMFGRQLKMSE